MFIPCFWKALKFSTFNFRPNQFFLKTESCANLLGVARVFLPRWFQTVSRLPVSIQRSIASTGSIFSISYSSNPAQPPKVVLVRFEKNGRISGNRKKHWCSGDIQRLRMKDASYSTVKQLISIASRATSNALRFFRTYKWTFQELLREKLISL